MCSTNAIDLSKLAALSLVEQLSFETLLAEMKLDFAARCAATAIAITRTLGDRYTFRRVDRSHAGGV
jgi:phage-related baseplate assembly protein